MVKKKIMKERQTPFTRVGNDFYNTLKYYGDIKNVLLILTYLLRHSQLNSVQP